MTWFVHHDDATIPSRHPDGPGDAAKSRGRKIGMQASRDVLAPALCDAVNGRGTWDALPKDNGGRAAWLHRADRVIGSLAERDHVLVPIEALDEPAGSEACHGI